MKFLDILTGALACAVLLLFVGNRELAQQQNANAHRLTELETRMTFSMPHTVPTLDQVKPDSVAPRKIPQTRMVSYNAPAEPAEPAEAEDLGGLDLDLDAPAEDWKPEMDALKSRMDDLAAKVAELQSELKVAKAAKVTVADTWDPGDFDDLGGGGGSSGSYSQPVATRVVSRTVTRPTTVYAAPQYTAPVTYQRSTSVSRPGLFGRVRSGGGSGFFRSRAVRSSCPGGVCPL